MKEEGKRWIKAAEHDLKAAHALYQEGYNHLSAFHAQQASEKALKGLLRLLGRVPWGHSCFDLLGQVDDLLSEVVEAFEIPLSLYEAVQRLDSHYISSRYPDAFPTGVPADHYNAIVAEEALEDAEAILEFVQDHLP